MQVLNFKFNWFDYLTPCPFKKDVMVGEYDCSVCPYHKSFKIIHSIDRYMRNEQEEISYTKYFEIGEGIVECIADEFNKIENEI